MNNYTLRAGAVALVFSIAAFPQLSIANTTAYAETNLYGSIQRDTRTGASGQAIQASAFISDNLAPATGQAAGNATATEGFLRASASSSASVQPYARDFMSDSGRGMASWSDSLTVGFGGMTRNQNGYITAALNLSGMRGANMGPLVPLVESADVVHILHLWGTGMTGYCGYYSYCGTERITDGSYSINTWGSLPSLITVNIPVTFGSPTGLGYTLEVSTSTYSIYGGPYTAGRASYGPWADSSVDYSLSWGGITGVFDASGNAVSNFTVTSVSGFDYASAAPVPEPETYAMLLAGLGLVGFTARRRQRTRRII